MRLSLNRNSTEESPASPKLQLNERKKTLRKFFQVYLKESLPVPRLPSLLKTAINAARITVTSKILSGPHMPITPMKPNTVIAITGAEAAARPGKQLHA